MNFKPIGLAAAKVAVLFLAVCVASYLGASRTTPDTISSAPEGFGGFGGPQNNQPSAPQTNFAGVIDPTNAAYAGGMICHPVNDGGAAAIAAQNTLALQAAISTATTLNLGMIVPPCIGYPMSRASGQTYAINLSGNNNLTIDARGATFRMYGDAASTEFEMFCACNVSHVHVVGATFSQRDVTNSTADTVAWLIGDNGSHNTDDVLFEDCAFVEGVGGDYIRLNGGSSAVTVTRVTIALGSRFENAAHAAIDVRPGVAELIVSYSFFQNNVDRDLLCEAATDNLIGKIQFMGNTVTRATSTSAASITVSGNGGANSNERTQISQNDISDGVIEAVNLKYATFYANDVRYAVNHGSTALIDLSGGLDDVTLDSNNLDRHTGATAGKVLSVVSSTPGFVRVTGNRIRQYVGVDAGIELTGNAWVIAEDNAVTYHNSAADSGSGFVGILGGSSSTPFAGQVSRNRVHLDDQDIRASLNLASVTTHDDTVVEALSTGTYGNAVTVRFIGDAVANAGTQSSSGTAATIHFKPAGSKVSDIETLLKNNVLIRVKTTGTAATVLQAGDAFGPTALAGAAQAGRMQAGIKIVDSGSTTVGSLTMRDNVLDGSTTGYVVGSGSTTYPNGVALISGTLSSDNTAEQGGSLATKGWVTDRTPDSETVASGALNIAKHLHVLTTANTQSYTIAAGVRAGDVHTIKIKSTSGTPAGTLTTTPTLSDGSTHTVTWGACSSTTQCAFDLIWDGSNYYIGAGTVGVTVN